VADTPGTKRTPRTLGETAGLLRGQQWATDAWREHARLSDALGDSDGAAAAREAGRRSLDREWELMEQGTDDARELELEEDPLEHLDFVEASAATIGRHAIDRRERGQDGTEALLGRQWALVLRATDLHYETSKDLPGTKLSVASST